MMQQTHFLNKDKMNCPNPNPCLKNVRQNVGVGLVLLRPADNVKSITKNQKE